MSNKKKEVTEEINEELNESSVEETMEEESEKSSEETEEESEDNEKDSDKKEKKDAVIEELNDKLKRQMAEFENFRKRSEKEKSQMYDLGAKAILEKILPVIDNFERGLMDVSEDTKNPFEQGMQMIYKQLTSTLDEVGLKPIVAVGETFDPEYHNAVMHEENDSFGENEITEELQKGYMFHDSVVRHSMVKVAN